MPENNIKNIIEQERQRKIILWISITMILLIIISIILYIIFRKDTAQNNNGNIPEYPRVDNGDIIRIDGDTNKNNIILNEIQSTVGVELIDFGPVLDYNFINNKSGIYIRKDGEIRTFELLINNGNNLYDFITNKLYKINKSNIEKALLSNKSKYLAITDNTGETFVYTNRINEAFSAIQIFNKKNILEYTISDDEKYFYYSQINNIGGSSIYKYDLANNNNTRIVNIPIIEYTLYSYNNQLFAKTKPSDEVKQTVFIIDTKENNINIYSDENNDNNNILIRKNKQLIYNKNRIAINTALEKCNKNTLYILCFHNSGIWSIDDWYKKNYPSQGEVLSIYNTKDNNVYTTNKIPPEIGFNIFSIKASEDNILFINKDEQELWYANINYLLN